MDDGLCNENTLRIASVNRYVPVWTNIFLLLPALVALSQIHNRTLVIFGIFGLIVTTISFLHHLYSNQDLNPKDLCKKKALPEHTKFVKSLRILDILLALLWAISGGYLLFTSSVDSWVLKGTALVLLIIAMVFFFVGGRKLDVAMKYYKKFKRNNSIAQENVMEYDLYHGFWHTILGMTLFIVIFLHM